MVLAAQCRPRRSHLLAENKYGSINSNIQVEAAGEHQIHMEDQQAAEVATVLRLIHQLQRPLRAEFIQILYLIHNRKPLNGNPL